MTELVDSAPHEISIAPDLLGHADLETTQRYYVLAEGMTAHVRVQEVIAARRRAAASRCDDRGLTVHRAGDKVQLPRRA